MQRHIIDSGPKTDAHENKRADFGHVERACGFFGHLRSGGVIHRLFRGVDVQEFH
ncbi:MAG: hypothetical protein ACOH1Y_18340 [Propionicimonas sp.]